ncbi:MAG: MBL fold metallo-hydrolase [Pseudomonadota bacterium]
MRPLGVHLAGAAPLEADLLYTHTHLDHVCGFPFFIPFFNPQNKFRLWAGHLIPDHTLRGVLEMMLTPPLFPVPLDIVQAELTFRDFPAGETLEPRPGVTIKTAPLNHPNNATGYRIEFGGRALCYITDTEHYAGRRDETIVELVEGADIVIYDATYTDEEYPNFKSWGHSTWQEGVRVADASNVKTLVIFHHDPSHDDVFMDKIGEEAEGMRPGTIVAREGMVLSL